jgi:hypothetical protein
MLQAMLYPELEKGGRGKRVDKMSGFSRPRPSNVPVPCAMRTQTLHMPLADHEKIKPKKAAKPKIVPSPLLPRKLPSARATKLLKKDQPPTSCQQAAKTRTGRRRLAQPV